MQGGHRPPDFCRCAFRRTLVTDARRNQSEAAERRFTGLLIQGPEEVIRKLLLDFRLRPTADLRFLR